jgi:hypothetical protein
MNEADLLERKMREALDHTAENLRYALYADMEPPRPPTWRERLKARIDALRNRVAYWIATEDAFY